MSKLDVADQFTVEAALGRIFRMGARPTQPGDVEEYERCRAAVLNILEPAPSPLGHVARLDHSPNIARNRGRGA